MTTTNGMVITNNGTYSLYVESEDMAGNRGSDVKTFTLDIPAFDTNAPFIFIKNAASNKFYSNSINACVIVTDACLIGKIIKFNDKVMLKTNFAITNDGISTIFVSAWDDAGNSNVVSTSFVIDTKKPEVYATGLEVSNYFSNVRISFTAVDTNLDKVTALLNDVPVLTNQFLLTNPGNYTLVVSAVDKAGNSNGFVKTFELFSERDNVVPAINISGLTDQFYKDPVNVSVLVTDDYLNTNKTEVIVDRNIIPLTNGRAFLRVTTEGRHNLAICAEDYSSNLNRIYKDFIIDYTAPVIEMPNIFSNHSYVSVMPLVQVTDNYSNSITVRKYQRREVPMREADMTEVENYGLFTNEGSYTIMVTASDEAGNTAVYQTKFNIAQDFESTLLFYADFNDRDYGHLYYGITNQWVNNSGVNPYFVSLPSGRGIKGHNYYSPGVQYSSISSNKLLNPVKGTIEFYIQPLKSDSSSFNPVNEMTLLDIRTNETNGVSFIKFAIDPVYGTVFSIMDRKIYLDNNWDSKWYERKEWKKLRLEYSLYEEQSRSYIRFYGDNELIARVESIGFSKLPIPANGKLYFGYSPADTSSADSYFYLDELRIYEDVRK